MAGVPEPLRRLNARVASVSRSRHAIGQGLVWFVVMTAIQLSLAERDPGSAVVIGITSGVFFGVLHYLWDPR